MRRSACAAVSVLTLLGATGSRPAAPADEAVLPPVKVAHEGEFADVVQQGSIEIGSGQLEGRRPAAAHAKRSVAYSNLYCRDESIADLSKAVELERMLIGH